jgi:hypothetical protein
MATMNRRATPASSALIGDQSGWPGQFKPPVRDRPLCGRGSEPPAVARFEDCSRSRDNRRIDHPTIDNLRAPLDVGRNDSLRPGDLGAAGHELFQHGCGLGGMDAELAAGARGQGAAARPLEGLSVMDGERRSVQRGRLAGRAAGDRQSTKRVFCQRLRRRDRKVEEEVGRPKRQLADKAVGGDIASPLHAQRRLNLGEHLDIVAKPVGYGVNGVGAVDLGRAKPLNPKRSQGFKIGVMPRRTLGVAPDKDRNG